MAQSQKTILLIFGGKSPEHEVAIKSARTIFSTLINIGYDVILLGISKENGKMKVIEPEEFSNLTVISDIECNLDQNISINNYNYPQISYIRNRILIQRKFDIAFPCIHGSTGEDGMVQGWLNFQNIPYAGSNLRASAIGIDKDIAKHVTKDLIISPPYLTLYRGLDILGFERSLVELNTKNFKSFTKFLIVKPSAQGSSIGVFKVSNELEFQSAIDQAFRFDTKVLVEQCIDSTEIEVAVYGSPENPVASEKIAELEVLPEFPFYDYDAKYVNNGINVYINARLSSQQIDYIREVSKKIYSRIGCRGLARVDFLLCKKSAEIYFNEINTMPGFNTISMFPRLFLEQGMTMEELILAILNS